MNPLKYSKALKAVSSKGKAIKYSHEAFLQAIHDNPADSNHRAIYADWLEDNAPGSASPETLEFLRGHQGEGWTRRTADGRVEAGDAVVPREHMEHQLSQMYPVSYKNGRTRLLHHVHGPNGSFGVVEYQSPYVDPGVDYQAVQFFPGWSQNTGFHDTPEQALQEAHRLSGLHPETN